MSSNSTKKKIAYSMLIQLNLDTKNYQDVGTYKQNN